MKKNQNTTVIFLIVLLAATSSCKSRKQGNSPERDTILVSDTIQYHPVRIDRADGSILPWFSAGQGESYDTVLLLVWDFWNRMETDSNGLKYYMNHQVWSPNHDMRGLGGDQLNMALSSWRYLYAYTGFPEILENMKYIAGNYLDRSLSGTDDDWPSIPYPYNTVIHSGRYDGDMRNGKWITQPDKAGNFGFELINLFKMTGDVGYLDAAKKIACTLASKVIPGDSLRSPLPFRVNARSGEAGSLFRNNEPASRVKPALYTSDWTCTMQLFRELTTLDTENSVLYENAFNIFLRWMKEYPLKTNKWGPFFEDIPGWSDTQTNAVTFAMFILQNRNLFPDWEREVKGIFDWTYNELGNHEYEKYGVTVMNEQTVYRVPGNSHSSRQASVELMYTALSGDTTFKTNAVRTLNWATYTVAGDGRNRYIRDDIWLTDGYGDYVRHYLRAMASFPELAPPGKNRLLGTSSVITFIMYTPDSINYKTFDKNSSEILRLKDKPIQVIEDGAVLKETESADTPGWQWKRLKTGGALTVSHARGKNIVIRLSD